MTEERAALVDVLSRVRRRLRAQAAMQAAVLSATAGAIASAVLLAASWWTGRKLMMPVCAAGTVAALAVLGGVAAALRKIPLARAARSVDGALGDGGDRTLSALALSETASGPFVEAVLRDALGRARRTPTAAAAPLRRPRGSAALAVGAAVVIALALVPPRERRAVASGPPPQAPAAPRLKVDSASLDAEREEIEAARKAAHENDDEELRRLAERMGELVKDLGGAGLPRGEAMDRLAEIRRQADEAAAEAEALRKALEAAGKALGEQSPSAALGKAMEKHDGEAAAKEAAALADRESRAGSAERQKVASGLDKAADGAAREARAGEARSSEGPRDWAREASTQATGTEAAQAAHEAEERQRRLARDRDPGKQEAESRSAEGLGASRQLERLERDMRQSAEACRRDPEACKRKLAETGDDLPKMEHESGRSPDRQAFARAVRQMQERLRRGGASGQQRRGATAGTERAFRKAAAGEDADAFMTGGDEDGDRSGMLTRPGESGDGAEPGDGEGRQPGVGSSEGPNPANGIGTGPGDPPLGARSDVPSRGHEREAKLKGGGGPTRSEVIEGAARKGFANARYQGVFRDYATVVEESLDATDTPPGRRYLVRRYFQLIRPRR